MRRLQELYFGLLPTVLMSSSIFGVANGFRSGLERKNPLDSFCDMVGYTSLGMLTGITYPISFPFLAAYVLCKRGE